MTAIEAREAVTAAAQALPLKSILELLGEHVDAQLEAATAANDKWLRQRLATDHRGLLQLADKVSS